MTALRAIAVEDSDEDVALLRRELERNGWTVELCHVQTEAELRRALAEGSWELVLSDAALPAFSAQAALQVLQETGIDLPFIIVSGSIDEEEAVAAMRAGAHDYITKGRLARLGPAIERELRDLQVRQSHRRAEAARSEAELRFRRIFDSGITGVTVVAETGRVLEANDAFLEMLGFTRADLEAGMLDWRQLTPEEWFGQNSRAQEELRATGRARPFEKEYRRKDGTRVPVLIGIAPLDAARVLTVITDISKRKALEDQLRHAQKMEAVGRLAGGVAHDFNNLLSVILSYTEMIGADMAADDPSRADIDEVRRAGKRAATLTRQLLMFSRQQVTELATIDLSEVLVNVERMLRRLVGEDVALTTTVESTLGMVRADRGLMEQVIMNLAVNARDAMPTGGRLALQVRNVSLGEGYVRSHLGARPGPHVLLSVTDTGTGMDEATMARIFEPYFTTKGVGKGTGLGLSTVFGIVEQSGGHVTVSSEVGLGTRFDVYLPRVELGAAEATPPPQASSSHNGHETILLVEDEAQVRTVARGILERHGYQVLEASGGEEALRLAAAHVGRIHLLLSDVVMPQMSGPVLAERMVRDRPDLRVLCMSGYTDDATTRHGVFAARLAYLQKPITMESLTRKVREVLDGAAPAG